MSRALSLFPQGPPYSKDTGEAPISELLASFSTPSMSSAGRFQGVFTEGELSSLFGMHLETAVLGRLGIRSAPSYWNVLGNLKCFPLTAPKDLLRQPRVRVWIRAPALAGATRGGAGSVGIRLRR